MTEDQLTSVQIKSETRDKLKILAMHNLRTMYSHLEWIINREFDKYEYELYKSVNKGRQELEKIQGD